MEKKYFKHKVENLINIDKIVTIHYFEFDKDFVSDYESHNFYELVYPLKNNIICNLDNKDVILHEGEMIIYRPNVIHSIRADKKTNPNVFIISFSTKSSSIKIFENRIIKLDKKQERYIYNIIEESKITFNIPVSSPYTTKMEFNDNKPVGGLQLIKNMLEIMLINAMRAEANKIDSDVIFLINNNYKNDLSGRIIEYLNKHIYETVHIKDLENEFHYNKSYLFSVFKKQTGHTISSYFNHLKIEKAKQLLNSSKLSIKDVSIKLSFDTPSYFCKVFKNIVGITPFKYKTSLK